MKITKNFSLAEFACKDGTPYPAAWIATRLRPLCEALEVLRTALGGKAITIVSGYRTPAYNARIGGARRSQHVEGRAADITALGAPPARAHAEALGLYRTGTLVIGGLGAYPRFTHLDVRSGRRLVRWGGSRTTA